MSDEFDVMAIDREDGDLQTWVRHVDELLRQLSSDMKDIKMGLFKTAQTPSSGSKLPLSDPLKLSNVSEIGHEQMEQNAVIESLQTAYKEETRRCDEQARKVTTLEHEIAEKDQQIASYKKMIVRSSRREDGLNDSQIIELFVKLKSDIVSFCMKCLPAGVEVSPRFEGASPEIGDLFMRAEVADELYLRFFDPTTALFGHSDTMNDYVFRRRQRDSGSKRQADLRLSSYQMVERVFISAVKSGIMTDDEAKDWRIMTVNLARKAANEQVKYPTAQAENVWKHVLQRYSAHFASGKKKSHLNQTPEELIELCKTAYNIALLFRSSRIEYRWMQMDDNADVSPREAEVLGTTGVLQSEPHRVARIIFGGVIRGNRNTGKLEDGLTPLLRTGVVIGFP
ncbi:hypothetical protein F4824DRAFT_494262 [Ustulina deusta]|nr:hypothetical protein F4824DRAFT_494262 [Ustulina deusta]